MIAHQQRLLPEIAVDVWEGLRSEPKSLPPKLFYDAEGSRLFEEITRLPEYYPTRTEQEILRGRGSQIAGLSGPGLTVIELGAGGGLKTRTVLRALSQVHPPAAYIPVDVAPAALALAQQRLQPEFPKMSIRPMVADYTAAPLAFPPGRKLALYLGSSIGNFEPMDALLLLRRVRAALSEGDALLLGTDLVKHPSILLPAYDDAQGVTARFNKNVLARINRELGGEFQLERFRHVVLWNPELSRIEMHLESLEDQTAVVRALGLAVRLRRGERIHTENSYKYSTPTVDGLLDAAGFAREQTWTDDRNWFAVHVGRAR